ncbi:NADPH:quinone oxidoreductase family protein [Paracoccus hibiscisoli]|uniref:NADPH:quinone oxidoreductase family protein n=1 Tax=Paracoccus hibiscisoli TaxID=2023261 RepID=A0A4U0QPJ5_9RHOB|nr:NADPH:quinone oxidoreductase family protein [Paracoccus hibiscisoli]TJZ83765.1 NADPH:quinone oxidoreductase family protein [Paracoccus hibiscisoli]
MEQMIRTARIEALGQDPVIRDLPAPRAAPGQVLLRMGAAALNFADLLKAQGKYQEPADPPFVPGLEGAGTVLEAPAGSGLTPGMRVVVSAPGTMTQVMAVDPDAVQPIPDMMSFEQAAGFQVAYGTSHLALSGRGALAEGQVLVVLGAAGGVGLTAVEIGAAMGARVIGVARGADRLQVVRDAGAAHVIDSADCADLRGALRDLGGADVVYDPVGAEPGEAAFRALRPGGRFLSIGFAGGRPPALPLNHALVKNIAIHGFYWGGYRQLDPQALRTSMAALFDLFAAGRLHPVAGATLPLEALTEGYHLLRERRSIGKVVITL